MDKGNDKDFVEYYHQRLAVHRKARGGKGITQTDMAKAQAEVKEFLNEKRS